MNLSVVPPKNRLVDRLQKGSQLRCRPQLDRGSNYERHTASLVGLRGGWRHARTKMLRVHMDPMLLCPGKGPVLPKKPKVDQIATNVRFLLIPLQNVELSKISPFAIHKALIGIGGEPKSVKSLRSGDLLCLPYKRSLFFWQTLFSILP
ncbi:hypothetical protein TNCV_995721 [Trichonephila clavipes]|nr:hypothetical protein TNCV_995721 [Trichonephila clavipes]